MPAFRHIEFVLALIVDAAHAQAFVSFRRSPPCRPGENPDFASTFAITGTNSHSVLVISSIHLALSHIKEARHG